LIIIVSPVPDKSPGVNLTMKIRSLGVSLLLLTAGTAIAKDEGMHHGMDHGKHSADNRISLNLPPPMKLHQLQNMRAHLAAVQEIVVKLGEENFEEASNIAHQKLGLTLEMESMCNRFENEEFKKMGIGFHKSADKLGEILAKGDMENSLAALGNTMSYCVSCHAQFKQ
jgi:hypothetical protein